MKDVLPALCFNPENIFPRFGSVGREQEKFPCCALQECADATKVRRCTGEFYLIPSLICDGLLRTGELSDPHID